MIRILCLFLCLAAPVRAETVTVFAAASLKGPLDQAAEAWQAASGHDVQVAYAGSPTLARQIRQGAPADLAILAHPRWMEWLADQGVAGAAEAVPFLSNRLVLIAPGEASAAPLTPETVATLLGPDDRFAIALTDAVPAGIYGRASLEALGLWDSVSDRLLEMENVRAALALVARGEAPLGLVYATDALAEPAVSVVAELPVDSHPAIVYPLAVLAETEAADAFAAYLTGDGRVSFDDAGFLRPGADDL
ncbi:molybdate ABC transporter substrate-binding protein [Aestuariibius sp. 2305UL40-4]|uniref:molybdate ABC transporter substrate-binding protein n=1 Tax=Aestuariibius violaceus TaxID=3234132 RepID=UPI00345E8A10